jgi:uncharacterized membrane protein (UPF0136 family)
MEPTAKKSKALILFGAYLLVAGLIGYLSNPSKALTALYSGGLFGLLSIASGILLKRGYQWALKVGLALVSLLIVTFAWRASVGWLAVSNGASEKLFAAALISSMLLAAIFTLKALLKRHKL